MMIHCISKKASMRAEQFLYFKKTAESRAKNWYQKNAFQTPGGSGCCLILDGGSVVVNFLFIVLPLWESVNVLCFVVRYFMSILDLQLS